MQQNRLLAKVFQYQTCESPGGFPKNAAAPANREQHRVASIHFRRTSPTPSSAGTNRCVFLFPPRPQSRRLSPWRGRQAQFADAQKLSFQNCIIKHVQWLNIGAKAKYAPHPSERIRSTPSLLAAMRFLVPTIINHHYFEKVPTTLKYCGHNIEFSCPAASTQNCVELPSCIHRSTRPQRGQLQRSVRWRAIWPFWQPI